MFCAWGWKPRRRSTWVGHRNPIRGITHDTLPHCQASDLEYFTLCHYDTVLGTKGTTYTGLSILAVIQQQPRFHLLVSFLGPTSVSATKSVLSSSLAACSCRAARKRKSAAHRKSGKPKRSRVARYSFCSLTDLDSINRGCNRNGEPSPQP